jgi:hypothetical protein
MQGWNCHVVVGTRHSLQNRTSSLVEPEKPGTDDLAGLLSALDCPRHQTGKNQVKRLVLMKASEPLVWCEPPGSVADS